LSAPIRILLAKMGLDTHTIGITVLAKGLRDAGFEVIFSGFKQTPEVVVASALQEDVDVVGVSSLSGGHMRYIPHMLELMKEHGIDDKIVLVGGVIPEEDIEELQTLGVDRVFTMGSAMTDMVQYIKEAVAAQRGDENTSEALRGEAAAQ
jgi:methylmalonyl-CoA mutase, C-terminal domain